MSRISCACLVTLLASASANAATPPAEAASSTSAAARAASATDEYARATKADDAIARETALLLAEKQALAETRAQLGADRAARVEILAAHIAGLERAAAVTANATARQAVSVEQRQRVRAALDDSRAKSAILSNAQQVLGRPTTALADAFAAARAELARDAHEQRIESLFFDLEGNLVQGSLLRFGPVAAVAMSANSAGPVVAVSGAWERVPASAAAEAAVRAAFAKEPGDAALIPLALGPADFLLARTDAAGRPHRSFVAVTRDAGAPAWLALALGALALCAATVRAASLARQLFVAKHLGQTIPDLVRRLELTRAVAACKRVGGATAEILAEIVRATTHVNQGQLEDRAIELVLDENARTERVLAIAGIAAGAALGVGAWSFSMSLADAAALAESKEWLAPVAQGAVALSRALLCGVPALVACALGALLRARLRVEIERAATNVVTAAQAAARDSFV